MPKITGAKKALRQSKRRHIRNLESKSKIKAAVKGYKLALKEAPKDAQAKLSEAYKAIDKVLKTKFIKKNTASRMKSRLAKRLNAQNKA